MVEINYTELTNAIVDAIPVDVFLWIKFAMIAIVIFFVILIIKNIIQIGTSSRIIKTLKIVKNIDKKVNLLCEPSIVTEEVEQKGEFDYQ